MKLKLYSGPSSEPVPLAEAKEYLRLTTETFAGDIESVQSIAPGSHVTGTINGTAVEVLGLRAVVELSAGTCSGTVDVTIQDSDDGSTWADVEAFTQVTAANDNTTYEKAYDGIKRYLRVVAVVATDSCEFGVSIIKKSATIAEESLLTSIIEAARERVEEYTGRKIMTQTWDYYLDAFPEEDYIVIPFGNLQDVTSITYTDSDGNTTTMTADTDYVVEKNGEGLGRVVLPNDTEWPTATLKTSNPIVIRFVCGWTSASLVPESIKTAIKMLISDLWENRESQTYSVVPGSLYVENATYQKLLSSKRLRWQF